MKTSSLAIALGFALLGVALPAHAEKIVNATEAATNTIITCTEEIEEIIHELRAQLPEGYQSSRVNDMNEAVVKIFEACNFQDLTGQRIANVAQTLDTVQAHLTSLLRIWGDISDLEEKAMTSMRAANEFLNGPLLAGDEGHYSQADIDALFDAAPAGVKSAA